MELAWDSNGLLPAIAQDRLTGEVRMLAYVSRESLARTMETGRLTFFSRSRNKLWEKGEESGNTLVVREIVADCDRDTLLFLVEPKGPTCHTGSPSCFFHRVGSDGQAEETAADDGKALLLRLEQEIASRKHAPSGQSYTRTLLDGGAETIGAKLREEADELARAIASESEERVANEAADVMYHLLVGLASRGVAFADVLGVLAARAGKSGLVEKAERKRSP